MEKRIFVLKKENGLEDKIREAHPKRPKIHIAKYRYIIHLVIHEKTFIPKGYVKDGKPLNVSFLREKLKTEKISEIINNLEKWGYIYCSKKYNVGINPFCFKLGCDYENSPIGIQFLKGNKFLKKLDKNYQEVEVERRVRDILRNHVKVSKEGINYIKEKYTSLTGAMVFYGTDNFREMLEDCIHEICVDAKDTSDLILFSFLLGDFYIKLNTKVDRLFHSFCNLSHTHRNFILLDGQQMGELDIVNSQVVFSVALLKSQFKNETPEDFNLYEKYACEGQFYEVLAADAGIDISDKKTRGEFKDRFFHEVFFSRVGNPDSPIYISFERLFPNVLQAIREVKKPNYKNFAIQLQKLEAEVMIQHVLKTLYDEDHLALPLHDSFFCNNADTYFRAHELVTDIMEEKYSLSVRFKPSIFDLEA
jgi:hypothetical protein